MLLWKSSTQIPSLPMPSIAFIFVLIPFTYETQDLNHKLVDKQHFDIEQKDVERAFLSINVRKSHGRKSHGPDNICGRLLKTCAKELSPVFRNIFNKSLQAQHVPKV